MKNLKLIQSVLNAIKQDSFTADYTATDTEAMGLLLSKYFEWNGIKILEAAKFALEDANYHTEYEVLDGLLKRSQ